MNIAIDDILYRGTTPKIKLVRNETDEAVLVEVTFNSMSLLITDPGKVLSINGDVSRAGSLDELHASLSAEGVEEFVYKTFIF